MAENKRYYWLRLNSDFFTSKRIKKLRRLAGGDTYTIIYLKMQLLSLGKGGLLEYTGLEETFYKELSLDLDEEEENVKVTVNYLISCGLLTTSDNIEYSLPFVQNNLGSESASTQRSRKSRQNKQIMLQCNTDATECNKLQQNCNVDIEKDIDTEIDKDIEKESIKESSPRFDVENAWIETYKIYPKKSGEATAKVEWMKKVGHSLDVKEVSKLVFFATKLYLSDYSEKNADDVNYKFLPRYDKWLQEDCDYWIRQYEEKQRSDDS